MTRGKFAYAVLAAALLAGFATWSAPEIEMWRWYMREGKPSVAVRPPFLGARMHWFDDYYVISDLGGGDYAIAEPRYGQCNFNYLIVGSARALLFDSGPGLRDIRPVVRSLTSLPVVAMPSHLHFDHVGNLGRFEDIALPDLPALREQSRGGEIQLGLYQFLGFVEGFERPKFTVTRWIEPGSNIDLGDRQVALWSVPGHTPDSVALRDARSNRLFAGDFIYPATIFAYTPGANLQQYADSARWAERHLDDASRIFGAHGCATPEVALPELGRKDMHDLADALTAAANSDGQPTGWFPRLYQVNERITLLAKYPWMHQ